MTIDNSVDLINLYTFGEILMKSIFIKLLIAIPVIYLALLVGLWSSVNDSRPMLSLLDMMRSNSATEIIDFSSDEEKSSKPKPKPNKT